MGRIYGYARISTKKQNIESQVRNIKKLHPIWEKYALTVEEATVYFGIEEKVFRRSLKEHANEDFLISNGVKTLVKRQAFEHYLDEKVTEL